MNFKMSGQKINILCKTKYLRVLLDEHRTFKYHLENLELKPNRANIPLAKVRCYVKSPLLRILSPKV